MTPEGKTAGLADRYCYNSHDFVDRLDAPHLQAADLLAWEWTKLYAETAETIKRQIRPVRKSLQALMHQRHPNIIERHLTGSPLQKFLKQLSFLDEI